MTSYVNINGYEQAPSVDSPDESVVIWLVNEFKKKYPGLKIKKDAPNWVRIERGPKDLQTQIINFLRTDSWDLV